MANRAYLYTNDGDDYGNFDVNSGTPYGDSRWTMPFAWLFFFQAEEVKIGSGYTGIQFLADKEAACALLERRLFLLLSCLSDARWGRELIESLLDEVRRWQGKYLHLDPSEIYEEDPAVMQAQVIQFIQAIDAEDTEELLALAASCEVYLTSAEDDYFVVNLIGALYSEAEV